MPLPLLSNQIITSMKSIWRTEFRGTKILFMSNVTANLIRTEKEFGIEIVPTGLQDDEFGRGVFLRSHQKLFRTLAALRLWLRKQ